MAPLAQTGLLLAVSLGCATSPSAVRAQPIAQFAELDPGIERAFRGGMASYAARDYGRAEALFRQILDQDPELLRVRLELARTLFMAKKDEQADYHFQLAAGEDPPAQVMRNIVRFREAIRARRAWRFEVDVGFAPDSNINSATDRETVDIHGLPFKLDANGRARSGVGRFFGGQASVRLNRFGNMAIYLGAYGRWTTYRDDDFDHAYAGAEAGPEFQLAGGRLRTTATALMRWHGRRPLVQAFGARLAYDRRVGGKWTVGGTLAVRHDDYARRHDVDGWNAEARVSANRPLGRATLGFAYAGVERSWSEDRGQAFWRERIGGGVVKEIGWGLRPELGIDIARQVNDGPLAPFGKQRRDWQLQGSVSIYKRDWNLGGFAPSLRLTVTRNRSTLPLYDEQRRRAEIRLTKAF